MDGVKRHWKLGPIDPAVVRAEAGFPRTGCWDEGVGLKGKGLRKAATGGLDERLR